MGLLPGAKVQALQGRQLERGDRALTVGSPVNAAIVDAHQVGVSGEPHITLENVGTFGDRPNIGLEGLFGQVLAGSAVGDDLRSPVGVGHDCFGHEPIVPPSAPICPARPAEVS